MARIAGSKYRSGKVNSFVPAKTRRNGRQYDIVPASSKRGGAGGSGG